MKPAMEITMDAMEPAMEPAMETRSLAIDTLGSRGKGFVWFPMT